MAFKVDYTAKEIIEVLNTRVVSQEGMKKALGIAIRGRHLANKARVKNNNLDSDYKTNVLLQGPTGSGKTEAARTLERNLGWPIYTVKATSFTPAGIVGQKVNEIPSLFLDSLTDEKIPKWFIEELDAGVDVSLFSDCLRQRVVKDIIVKKLKCLNLTEWPSVLGGAAAGTVSGEDILGHLGREVPAHLSPDNTPEQLAFYRGRDYDEDDLAKIGKSFINHEWRSGVDIVFNVSTMLAYIGANQHIVKGEVSFVVSQLCDLAQDYGSGRRFRPGAQLTNTYINDYLMVGLFYQACGAPSNPGGIAWKLYCDLTEYTLDGLIEKARQWTTQNQLTEGMEETMALCRLSSIDYACIIGFIDGALDSKASHSGIHIDAQQWRPSGEHGKSGYREERSFISVTKEQKVAFIERYGIVFIDEIDKIVHTEAFHDNIQRELLLLVEGGVFIVDRGISIDTTGVLFIGAGSFSTSSIDDMMPELRGRFPIHATLDKLNESDLTRILKLDSGPMERHRKLLHEEGVEITFDEEIYPEIANKCLRENNKKNIGARRINDTLAKILQPIYLEPERYQGEYVIDLSFCQGVTAMSKSKFVLI